MSEITLFFEKMHKVFKNKAQGCSTPLKKHNASLYISHLSNINWNELVSSHHDVNMAWCRFKKTLISILDKVAPIKEVRLKQRAKPWMNSEILNDIRERDNLLHNLKKKTAVRKICLRNTKNLEIKFNGTLK